MLTDMKYLRGKIEIMVIVIIFFIVQVTPVFASNTEIATHVSDEVIAMAYSYDHARQIALENGIELILFSNGVATFTTPAEIQTAPIRYGIMQSAAMTEFSFNSAVFSTHEMLYDFSVNQFRDDTLTESARDYGIPWHHAVTDSVRAHELSTGAGIVIAVIDTGIDISHPAFRGRISPLSFNSFTNEIGIRNVQDDSANGHGTHVSGIIAGIAPDAEIMVIKANIPGHSLFDNAAVLRGVNYAVRNGAHIINLSLGRHHRYGANLFEHRVIRNAVNNGVTIVASAGNDRHPQAAFPAAYPEVIAVSSVRSPGVFDEFVSNFGEGVDLSAPGSHVFSTLLNGEYGPMTGTSMAAPNVAGVAALVKSLDIEMEPQRLRENLTRTATQINANYRDLYGYGIVNAYAATRYILQGHPPLPMTEYSWSVLLAEHDVIEMQYRLGRMYSLGENGAVRNISRSIYWIRSAAEGEHSSAQNQLGALYVRGHNEYVLQSYDNAAYWFRRAALRQNPQAQNNLGVSYQRGFLNNEQSSALAAHWFRTAANQNFVEAQFNLARLYHRTSEYYSAIHWYTLAAVQGHTTSQVSLGEIYSARQNYEEAIYWFRIAAGYGNMSGQERMGRMYEQGRGVPLNIEQAIYWYRQAAAQGSDFANNRLNILGAINMLVP